MTATTHTCTVTGAVNGRCGKPAVWVGSSKISDDVYAECAVHAAQPGSLASTPGYGQVATGEPVGDHGHRVGDYVVVSRYGCRYVARVTRVGARGAEHATFTYSNGAERTVRVDGTCEEYRG